MSAQIPNLVSTIIPVYNRPQLLAEAVSSVLAQTYRPLEIIIVDDGSTDGTAAVGEAFAASLPDVVRYVRKENEGFARAINTGLRLVRGDFVQFLDSDDLLMPDKFAIQVEGLRSNPECGISYCYAREYVLGGRWSGRPARRTGETFAHFFPHILSGRLWPSPVPLYRREVIETSGLYRALAVHPEWEYECRAAARGVRLHHCLAFLTDVRGTHHLEGRQKGGVPPHKLRDYVEVLEGVLGHARKAQIPAVALDRLSIRLFAAARLCANAGFESEARHCLALALDTAASRKRRWRMDWYAAVSDRLGWQAVGHWCEKVERGGIGRASRAGRRWPSAFYARWRHRATVAIRAVSGGLSS